MLRWLQGAVVVGYAALLGLALLPRGLEGPAAALGQGARALLRSVGVVPGIGVFPGFDGPFRLAYECLSVEGSTSQGDSLPLYTMKCPPRGMLWRHGGFDHLMQQLIRNTRTRGIVEEARRGEISPDLWRLVAVGDYFCHSPLVSPKPRSRVTLQRTQYQRIYGTSSLASHTTRCTWTCRQSRVSIPECVADRRRRAVGRLPEGGTP